MQAFSSMRRNRTDKKILRIFFLVIGIVFYISISDIYYLLPPLFGVIYVLAQERYEANDINAFYWLIPLLIFLETSKGLPFLSTLLFMAFSFKVIFFLLEDKLCIFIIKSFSIILVNTYLLRGEKMSNKQTMMNKREIKARVRFFRPSQ